MAHLFSLSLVRDIFARHVVQGTGPEGYNPPVADSGVAKPSIVANGEPAKS
jgi:hypothetical protein